MAYQDANGNWHPGMQGDYASTHGQNTGRGLTGNWGRVANMATSGSDPLRDAAYGVSPESKAYYAMQQGNALRGISASYAPQRSYALQALEARGLGRSSEVGRTLGSLAASQGMASQQAIGDIQGQQYAERQARINAYMNYLYQKKLQKSGGGGALGFLETIGQGVGSLLGGTGGSDTPSSGYSGYTSNDTPDYRGRL